MALIKCPECGKEISNKAPACIHCGYPIANSQQEQSHATQPPAHPLPSNEDVLSEGFTLFSFDENDVNAECNNCSKVYKFKRAPNFSALSKEGCITNKTIRCPNCGNTMRKGLRMTFKQMEQAPRQSDGQNEVSRKQDDSSNSGCLGWLIAVGVLVACGMFLLTSAFTDFTLWWCIFPLTFAAFILVFLIYTFATADPKEVKEGWDREKYNDYKFTCPMCGSKKVKKISTVNRAASVAATGLASGKIGKQYECDDCKHKW